MTTKKLTGKITLVTGASRRSGQATPADDIRWVIAQTVEASGGYSL